MNTTDPTTTVRYGQPPPLVSIVVVAYNGERYLREQMDSILAQTYEHVEVIVADDCSSDSTPRILEHYAGHAKVSIHINNKNLGLHGNFSRAASLAKGAYICPCDQDDIWHPKKIERLLAAIGTGALVYSSSRLMHEDGSCSDVTLSQSMNINPVAGQHPLAFCFSNCVPAHAMLFRRELLDIALPLPTGAFPDRWIAYVASLSGSITYVDDPLVCYRQHSQSVLETRARAKNAQTTTGARKAESKEARRIKRNQEMIRWLEACRDVEIRIHGRSGLLSSMVSEYRRFEDAFINFRLFKLIYHHRQEFFYISNKNKFLLCLKESLGRKFYRYLPVS